MLFRVGNPHPRHATHRVRRRAGSFFVLYCQWRHVFFFSPFLRARLWIEPGLDTPTTRPPGTPYTRKACWAELASILSFFLFFLFFFPFFLSFNTTPPLLVSRDARQWRGGEGDENHHQ
ncbi:hypothetical protein V8C37DRAFT_280245 [Trichoderma ceciliae]